ncbi:MAG: hypothetical protein ACRDHK_06670, partial [Actinomycetota bacterium]
MRRPATALAVTLALLAGFALPSGATVPFPSTPAGADLYDYAAYLFLGDGSCEPSRSSELPGNFDCVNDWKFTDHRDGPEALPPGVPGGPQIPALPGYDPLVANNPQEFYGVKGVGLNRAWEVTTGRPDVIITVLDSG